MASHIASDVSLASEETVVSLPNEEEISSEVTAAVSLATEETALSLPNEEVTGEVTADASLPNEEEISSEVTDAAVSLPRFVLLRNKHSPYLLACDKGNPSYHKDYVRFEAPTVGMLEARFEVHKSTTVPGMVHIRSCYNNRYLTLNDNTENFAVVKAENIEEDQSKRSCTLFNPTMATATSIRLYNAHLGKRLCIWRSANVNRGLIKAFLSSNQGANDDEDVFTFIDWQSVVILPRYVAFHNQRYLYALTSLFMPSLHFGQEYITTNPILVANEIIQTADNKIRIRNMNFNKRWHCAEGLVMPVGTDTLDNFTLFEAVKLGEDTIGLKSVAANRFCRGAGGKINFLVADLGAVNSEGTLKVVEVVSSSTISDYDFHLENARIYDETIKEMDKNVYTNNSSTPDTHEFTLTTEQANTTTWSSSVSLKVSYSTSFSVGVPGIVEGEVTLGAEVSGTYEWGKTTTEKTTRSNTYRKEVLPGTKVTMRVIATHGVCDVPFSYTRRDVLYTGQTVTQVMNDGIFTGANYYSYEVESSVESLDKNPNNINTEPEWKKVGKLSESGELIPIEEPQLK